MKRYTLIIALFLFSVEIFAAKRDSSLLQQNVFGVGEKAKYKVYYKLKEVWVTAGNVEFEIDKKEVAGKEFWHIDTRGKSAPAFDLFFKVRDKYESVIDPETLLPMIFLRDVNEGGYKIFQRYDFFNRDSGIVESEVEDYQNPNSTNRYSIPTNAHDLVSAIYYSRNFNLNGIDSGHVFSTNVFLDNKNYKVGIRYLGKEKVVTDFGTYDCVVGQPLLIEGRIFDKADGMRIYMTDDDKRIPVMITSPLVVGEVMVLLTDYKQGK